MHTFQVQGEYLFNDKARKGESGGSAEPFKTGQHPDEWNYFLEIRGNSGINLLCLGPEKDLLKVVVR